MVKGNEIDEEKFGEECVKMNEVSKRNWFKLKDWGVKKVLHFQQCTADYEKLQEVAQHLFCLLQSWPLFICRNNI